MAKKRLIDGYAEDGYWDADALAAATARIEKLERMVVWISRYTRLWDGTTTSILAAVEKAMGEK